jgi:hypothetical protein
MARVVRVVEVPSAEDAALCASVVELARLCREVGRLGDLDDVVFGGEVSARLCLAGGSIRAGDHGGAEADLAEAHRALAARERYVIESSAEGVESWPALLHSYLSHSAQDLHLALDGVSPPGDDVDLYDCRDLGEHLVFLAVALSVPEPARGAWRTLTEDHTPAEACARLGLDTPR